MTYQRRYHEKIKEKCIERSRWCYEKKNKERMQKMARDTYKALPEEDKKLKGRVW